MWKTEQVSILNSTGVMLDYVILSHTPISGCPEFLMNYGTSSMWFGQDLSDFLVCLTMCTTPAYVRNSHALLRGRDWFMMNYGTSTAWFDQEMSVVLNFRPVGIYYPIFTIPLRFLLGSVLHPTFQLLVSVTLKIWLSSHGLISHGLEIEYRAQFLVKSRKWYTIIHHKSTSSSQWCVWVSYISRTGPYGETHCKSLKSWSNRMDEAP